VGNGKNDVANNPGFFARMENLDPQHLASKTIAIVPTRKFKPKKKNHEKIKRKIFQKFVLIEKLSSTEFLGRNYPNPVPKKMCKFHQEKRGTFIFLIPNVLWEKHRDKILEIIKEKVNSYVSYAR